MTVWPAYYTVRRARFAATDCTVGTLRWRCLYSQRLRFIENSAALLVVSAQGRLYVGAGATCPPDSLVATHIQKLADRSDVIFEVPKCSKLHKFSEAPIRTPLGELTALLQTP